ncbi:NUDIX domain protein [Beauveria brongniartii RCEF 3172]|uniref:NUDIX domain protein n=1 Tax=Beauveria brongniartii RCEF 3172 TaxID=1081107 RepID=A0A167J6R1_9HYPO|nr:NUDIX domain protein [Beauveria brongniartii RCEF 3172]
MLESTQNRDYTTIPPLQQDSTTAPPPPPLLSSPTQVPPTWLTAASAVAHTVRITHIPGRITAATAPTLAPDTSGRSHEHQPLISHSHCIAGQLASAYYDAAAMAPLNPFSKAAIHRLRAYKPPPFPLWDRLPVRMRAAVLILLYADRFGDLRVVITMRAASLRNFSGHAALPGGKADNHNESPWPPPIFPPPPPGTPSAALLFDLPVQLTQSTFQNIDQIARREAWEEIGLPVEDRKIPQPFRVEKLCYLPPFLARTHVVVTPCVAYLHADAPGPGGSPPVVEHTLVPTLDASEVAAVFTAPFYNFLKSRDLPPQPGHVLPPGHWYDGAWINWKDVAWRVHNFYVPVNNQHVSRPVQGSAAVEETEQDIDFEGRFKVWGMTGRVMVDAARIAYGEPPEVEHNPGLGDADIIRIAEKDGAFEEAAGKGPSRI